MSLLRVSLLSSALLIIGHRLPWLAGRLACERQRRPEGGQGTPFLGGGKSNKKVEEEEESCSSSPPLLPPTSIPPLLSLTWQKFPLHLFFLGASLERPPGWGGGGGGASLKVRLGEEFCRCVRVSPTALNSFLSLSFRGVSASTFL